MDLHIFRFGEAVHFQPTKPTLALRIHDSQRLHPTKRSETEFWPYEPRKLKDSNLYVAVKQYVFDDIDEKGCTDLVVFNQDIGTQILQDFVQVKDDIQAVMVHCRYGRNRSPAVGMALNHIFNLGYTQEELEKRFPHFTRSVYKKMIDMSELHKVFNIHSS